jgi:hypothetical protein
MVAAHHRDRQRDRLAALAAVARGDENLGAVAGACARRGGLGRIGLWRGRLIGKSGARDQRGQNAASQQARSKIHQ